MESQVLYLFYGRSEQTREDILEVCNLLLQEQDETGSYADKAAIILCEEALSSHQIGYDRCIVLKKYHPIISCWYQLLAPTV